MKPLAIFITFFFVVTQCQASMSYFIFPDKNTGCKDELSNSFSFFLEQIWGYNDYAEVAQVANILHIDLSALHKVDGEMEQGGVSETAWQNLDSFTGTVDSFITKIKAHPGYYKAVKHNPDRKQSEAEADRILNISDTAEASRQYEHLIKNTLYLYPVDYNYLSSGDLLKDLLSLKQILTCYKKNGAMKIRLMYM